MSRTTKTILGITAIVLVFCGLACILGFLFFVRNAQNIVGLSPSQARDVGRQIADYTLPPGYKELTSMNMFTVKMVMLESADSSRPVIVLYSFDVPGASREEIVQQMKSSLGSSFSQPLSNQRVVEDHAVSIQGQRSALTVTEGDTQGVAMRQAVGAFKSKTGTALVMFIGSIRAWDWKLIEDFCASIK